MGSGFGKKMVREAQTASQGALARVEKLEAFREDVLRAMRQTFNMVEARLGALEEVMNAVVALVGKDSVESEIKRAKIESMEKQAEGEKAALEAALKEGRVTPAVAIGERSIIIGTEVGADGEPLYPTRVQMLYPTVKPEYKEKLLGAVVGAVVETPVGSKFTVNEIYDIVVKTPEELKAAADLSTAAASLEESRVLTGSETQVPTEELDEDVEKQLVDDLSAAADVSPTN